MVVDIRRHLTETARDLGNGSLPGDEVLTGCHHDLPRLPITTVTENRSWTPTGTDHHEIGDLVGRGEGREEVVLAVEATSTPTSRVISGSEWTDMNETAVETEEHEADHRSPEEGNGIITGTADSLAVGRAPLMMEAITGGHTLKNEVQEIWINLLPSQTLRIATAETIPRG